MQQETEKHAAANVPKWRDDPGRAQRVATHPPRPQGRGAPARAHKGESSGWRQCADYQARESLKHFWVAREDDRHFIQFIFERH